MKTIRASEIGTFQFCHRAWWYQYQGYVPENTAEIAGGSEIHEKHGRAVITSRRLYFIAYASLLIAFLMVAIWLVTRS